MSNPPWEEGGGGVENLQIQTGKRLRKSESCVTFVRPPQSLRIPLLKDLQRVLGWPSIALSLTTQHFKLDQRSITIYNFVEVGVLSEYCVASSFPLVLCLFSW